MSDLNFHYARVKLWLDKMPGVSSVLRQEDESSPTEQTLEIIFSDYTRGHEYDGLLHVIEQFRSALNSELDAAVRDIELYDWEAGDKEVKEKYGA